MERKLINSAETRSLLEHAQTGRDPGAELARLLEIVDEALLKPELECVELLEVEAVVRLIVDHLYTQYPEKLADPQREAQALRLGQRCSSLKGLLANRRGSPLVLSQAWGVAKVRHAELFWGREADETLVVFLESALHLRGIARIMNDHMVDRVEWKPDEWLVWAPRWVYELLWRENELLGRDLDAISDARRIDDPDGSVRMLVCSETFRDLGFDEVFDMVEALR